MKRHEGHTDAKQRRRKKECNKTCDITKNEVHMKGTMAKILNWLLILMFFFGCKSDNLTEPEPEKSVPGYYKASQTDQAPVIDGQSSETCWTDAEWSDIDQLWLGPAYTDDDFSGRYKVVWTPDLLYILVEITDDVLIDSHRDPLTDYWEDDCLEIFIDEDNSDGIHQYSYNAFAYHIALDYNVADIGPDQRVHLYSDHLEVKRTKNDQKYIWEIALKVYNDQYKDGSDENPTVTLAAGKKIGFAIAYCDSDSNVRENFIGSVDIPGSDKNRAWIDAGVFGTLELVK